MSDEPNENLTLFYVNGYRCFDARHTAGFGSNKN